VLVLVLVLVYNFTSRETWKQRASKMREVVVVVCVWVGEVCAYLFFLCSFKTCKKLEEERREILRQGFEEKRAGLDLN